MTAARPRLDQLAAAWGLPDGATVQLDALLAGLEGNALAPTAVTDPAAAVGAHIEDSLSALDLPEVHRATRIADLGAGAGFPGLVLAIALPDARVALVESTGRKAAFIDALAAEAGVVNARAEAWSEGCGVHDLVTARALAPLPVLVEYAGPLLALGGALVAWKGHRDAGEEADGAAAAAQIGFAPPSTRVVPPRQGADARHLHVYLKVRDTPSRYPRRPGMARKHPLHASDRA